MATDSTTATTTIRRLLVANRAEIASRVFRTCRRLGIETVAVCSDADAGLPYVTQADHVVRLPGSAPTDTYLRADLLVEAARRAGADAVHPGYGFLSENAGFARDVRAAGLTWVGPDPGSIQAMGSKVEAKRIMGGAGVPVLEAPGEPTTADLPLLVKASAGGGGRGMRVVRDLADLDTEVSAARAEAESAFGDGTVFVEPYVEHGRHVEVQVLGTPDGVVVLGTRDCSIQRRHQKIVEEAPARFADPETEKQLLDAARRAAEAIDYRNAGTVEFLVDDEHGRFWFLEMNTRLQVEHPVTELVHGVDLVELQLAVAEGRGVCASERHGAPSGTRDLPDGHAIEVRLYAEDPAADHAPQSGVLTTFEVPAEPGVRVDAGYASGSTVSTHYDAMLAKVVVHAADRQQAARQLAGVLRRARIHGITTNRDQLVSILTDRDFVTGLPTTAYLAGRGPVVTEEVPRRLAVVAALALAEHDARRRTVQRGIPAGWRNVVSQPHLTRFEGVEVAWHGTRHGYDVAGYRVLEVSETRVALEHDGVTTYADVLIDDPGGAGPREVHVDAADRYVRLREVPRFTDPAEALDSGSLLAPMPGTVTGVSVAAGDEVTAGQPVLVLEAMKMQHTIHAPHAGTVTDVAVTPGSQVAAGDVLAVVTPTDPAHHTTGSTDEEKQ